MACASVDPHTLPQVYCWHQAAGVVVLPYNHDYLLLSSLIYYNLLALCLQLIIYCHLVDCVLALCLFMLQPVWSILPLSGSSVTVMALSRYGGVSMQSVLTGRVGPCLPVFLRCAVWSFLLQYMHCINCGKNEEAALPQTQATTPHMCTAVLHAPTPPHPTPFQPLPCRCTCMSCRFTSLLGTKPHVQGFWATALCTITTTTIFG